MKFFNGMSEPKEQLVSFTTALKERFPQREFTAEDVERFRIGLEKHLREDYGFSDEEIRAVMEAKL